MAVCPDNSLWSSYVDGEVLDPWRSRMSEHLARCPECAKRVRELASVGETLRETEGSGENRAIASAAARILARLEAQSPRLPASSPIDNRPLPPWLRRKVSLPVPVFAAAGLALVLLLGYSLGAFAPLSKNAKMLASLSKVLASNQTDMETLARSMRQPANQAVVIEAPTGYVFEQSGNPEIFAIDALYNGSSSTAAGSSR